MCVRLAAFILAAAVLTLGPARAENRTFLVANNADAYGIDRCLATGARCGAPVATAYCPAREFRRAVSFHKIDRDAVTGTVSAGESCRGACEEFVAIECMR